MEECKQHRPRSDCFQIGICCLLMHLNFAQVVTFFVVMAELKDMLSCVSVSVNHELNIPYLKRAVNLGVKWQKKQQHKIAFVGVL